MDCSLPKGFTALARALKKTMNPRSTTASLQVGAAGGTLTLTASNAGTCLSLDIPAEGTLTPCLVPGEEFLKALKGAKAFTLADSQLETAGGRISMVPGDPNGFTHLTPVGGEPILDLELTSEIVAYAASAASSDATRPTMSAVLLDCSEEGLARLVTTDGFRLAVAEAMVKGRTHPRTIVSKEAFLILKDLPLGTVRVTASDDFVTFTGPSWRLTTEVKSGRFPDWPKVTPPIDSLGQVFNFDRKTLLCAIQKAAKVADPYNRNLRILLADTQAALILTHSDGQEGSAVVPVRTRTSVEPTIMAFNHLYLEAAVQVSVGSEITFRAKDSIGVSAWDAGSHGPWTLRTYIMPLRFSSDEAMTAADIRKSIAGLNQAKNASSGGFTCQGDLRVLGKVATLAGKGRSLPILQQVRLEGTPEGLQASASNLEVYLTVQLAGAGTHPPVLAEARQLKESVKGATRLSLTDQILAIDAVTQSTKPATDYPEFPAQHSHSDGQGLRMECSRDLLEFAGSAASQDASRHALNQVLLDLDTPGEARLVSTDGFRLAVVTAPASGDFSGQYLIPQEAVRLIGSMVGSRGESVSIHTLPEAKLTTFKAEGWTVTAKHADGPFPAYRKVIPGSEDLPHKLVVDRASFLRALAVVGAKLDDYQRTVDLAADGDEGRLVVENPESGRAEAAFKFTADGPIPAGMAFNHPYLKDLADTAKGDTLTFRFGGTGSVWALEEPLHGAVGRIYILPSYPEPTAAPAGDPVAEESAAVEAEPVPQSAGWAAEPVPADCEASSTQEDPSPFPAPSAGQGDEPEFVLVWRQDAKAVRALGGREAIKAARYRVVWEIKQSHGIVRYAPQAWHVPRTLLAELGITPISEAEANAIFRERSELAKARTAA